jgi:hypothetical protein
MVTERVARGETIIDVLLTGESNERGDEKD